MNEHDARPSTPPPSLVKGIADQGLAVVADRNAGLARIFDGAQRVGMIVHRGGKVAYAEYRGQVFPFWRYFEQTEGEQHREIRRFLAAVARH